MDAYVIRCFLRDIDRDRGPVKGMYADADVF